MIPTPKSVLFLSSGLVAAYDENGQQIPELQKAWMKLWLEHCERLGVDPREIKSIEVLEVNRVITINPVKVDDEWNW